jgi:hypothetical protein
MGTEHAIQFVKTFRFMRHKVWEMQQWTIRDQIFNSSTFHADVNIHVNVDIDVDDNAVTDSPIVVAPIEQEHFSAPRPAEEQDVKSPDFDEIAGFGNEFGDYIFCDNFVPVGLNERPLLVMISKSIYPIE